MGKTSTTVRDALPLLALMRSQRVEIWLMDNPHGLPTSGRRLTREQVGQLLAERGLDAADKCLLDAEVLEINGTDRCMAITAIAV